MRWRAYLLSGATVLAGLFERVSRGDAPGRVHTARLAPAVLTGHPATAKRRSATRNGGAPARRSATAAGGDRALPSPVPALGRPWRSGRPVQ